MKNLYKISEKEKTFKGKLSALIAEYFALLKHEILVDLNSEHKDKEYIAMTDDFAFESDEPTLVYRRYYEKDYGKDYEKMFGFRKKKESTLMNIPTEMMNLVDFEKSIIRLSSEAITKNKLLVEIERFYNRYPFLSNNQYLEKMKDNLLEIVSLYDELPERTKKFFKVDDMEYVYSYEINRLTKMFGISEFAEYLNWDNRKLSSYISKGNVPLPYQKLGATSLWTYGQVKAYKEVIENKKQKSEEMRNDWSTRGVVENKIELCEDSMGHFYFNESGLSFGIDMKIDELSLSSEDKIIFYRLFDSLHGNTLWIKSLIMGEYYQNKDWDEAIKLSYLLLDEYNKIITEEVKGKLSDGNYDYHSCLYIMLSYMQYLKGDKQESLRLAKEVDELYCDGIHCVTWGIGALTDDVEKFEKWIRENIE